MATTTYKGFGRELRSAKRGKKSSLTRGTSPSAQAAKAQERERELRERIARTTAEEQRLGMSLAGSQSVASPSDYPVGGQTFAAINDLRGGSTRARREDLEQQSFASYDDFPKVRTREAQPEVVVESASPGFQGTLSITEQPRREVIPSGRRYLQVAEIPSGVRSSLMSASERGERLNNPVLAFGGGGGLAALDLGRSLKPSNILGTVGGVISLPARAIVNPVGTGQELVAPYKGGATGAGRLAFDLAVVKYGGNVVRGGKKAFGSFESYLGEVESQGLLFSNVPAKVKKGSLLGNKESLSSVYGEGAFKTPKQAPFGFKAERRALLQREKSFLRESKAAPRTDILDSGRGGGNRVIDLTRTVKSSSSDFLSQKSLRQATKAREVQAKELFKTSDALSQIGRVRSTGRSAKSFGESFQNIGKFERKQVIARLNNKIITPSNNQASLLTPQKTRAVKITGKPPEAVVVKPAPEGFVSGGSFYSRSTFNPNRVRSGDTTYVYGGLENVGVGATGRSAGGFRAGRREALFGRLESLKADRLLGRLDERLSGLEASRLNVGQARTSVLKGESFKVGVGLGLGLDSALNVKSGLLAGLGVSTTPALSVSTSSALGLGQRTSTSQALATSQALTTSLTSTTAQRSLTASSTGVGGGGVVPPTTPPSITGTPRLNPPRIRTQRPPRKTRKVRLFKLDLLFPKKKKKKKTRRSGIITQEFTFTPTLVGQEYNVGITGGKVFTGVGRRRRKN